MGFNLGLSLEPNREGLSFTYYAEGVFKEQLKQGCG